MGGEDPVEAAGILHKYVVHVHAKDAVKAVTPGRKYDWCPVGDGIIPNKQALRVLKHNGYDGYVCLEYEGWKMVESKSAVKKSIDYLRKTINEI